MEVGDLWEAGRRWWGVMKTCGGVGRLVTTQENSSMCGRFMGVHGGDRETTSKVD